ncbi:MAG: hypothetical protein ACLP9S_01555 [Syntrophales bacterium]
MIKSERAADRVMEGTIRHLESELKLPFNGGKERGGEGKGCCLSLFPDSQGNDTDQQKAREKFKTRARELTRRNNPMSMHQMIQSLNEYLRG